MRLGISTLLCLLVAGCSAPSPPGLARGPDTQPSELTVIATPPEGACVVRTAAGLPVTDRIGTPVRC